MRAVFFFNQSTFTDISDQRTNRQAYLKMSEEQAPDLRAWNYMTAGNKSRLYKTKEERKQGLHGVRVVEPVNDPFMTAVDNQNHRLHNKYYRYINDVRHDLRKMAKKIVVLMKNRSFSGKGPMSKIALLQEFKSACDVYRIREGAALWLFKQFPASSAKEAVKVWDL